MVTKKVYYYGEADKVTLFDILNYNTEEGLISYEKLVKEDEIVVIDYSFIEPGDPIISNIESTGVILEDPANYGISIEDDMFDDFFNEEDFED